MRILSNEPSGEAYRDLIQYAISTSDVFMLFTCNYGDVPDYSKKMDDFLTPFMPLLVKTRHNGNPITKWPGTVSYDNRHERNFMFFRSDGSITESLMQPGRLYNWQNTDYPEDLCFFRNHHCWLATTAHENMAYVISDSNKETDTLIRIGLTFHDKEYQYDASGFFEAY